MEVQTAEHTYIKGLNVGVIYMNDYLTNKFHMLYFNF